MRFRHQDRSHNRVTSFNPSNNPDASGGPARLLLGAGHATVGVLDGSVVG